MQLPRTANEPTAPITAAFPGRIIWRHNGKVDGAELRAKVLEIMGRYYVPK